MAAPAAVAPAASESTTATAAPVAPKVAGAASTAPAADSTTVPAASASSASSSTSSGATTSAVPAAPAPAAAETASTPTAETAGSEPSLRRLDDGAPTSPAPEKSPERHSRRRVGPAGGDNARVQIIGNATLEKGETADAVVAILGNATSEGDVRDAVVAVLGNARATGRVGDAVVAVLGNVYVDGPVNQVVAVLGNIELGPNAEVRHDVVTVGGTVKRDPKAIVHGNMPAVGVGHVPQFEWLAAYWHQCVMKARPLAIAPHLGWLWAISLSFLALYVVLALLFRGGVEKTLNTLETRPGGSILASLLTLLLLPVLVLLLIITVVGIAVLPFLLVAIACATLFGKAVILAWLGKQVTRPFGAGSPLHPAISVAVGGIILLALYMVPILGWVLYKIVGVLGLGLVVYTLIGERRSRPIAVVAAAVPVAATAGVAMVGAPEAAAGAAGVAAPIAIAPAVAAATLPRAGFWIRIGALLIDSVLAILAMIFLPLGPGALVLLAVYGAVMWKFKGTTVGGIVCGLQVVRLDGRPIDWPTAIVRALSCFLSLCALGLGFIWVALDDEKQSWHDKIAGTTVVLTRGVSLV
jgi:uncharacterized RDD family membrane protein YckC